MEYIDESLLKFLRKNSYKHTPEFLNNLQDFIEFFNANLPKLAQKELHIIGMQHGIDFDLGKEVAQQAIDSQNEVLRLLDEINPDIVAVEGSTCEVYNLRNASKELLRLMGLEKPSESQIREFSHRILKDKENNAVVRYWKMKKTVKHFVGVESPLIQMLAFDIQNEIVRKLNFGYPITTCEEINQYLFKFFRLRGLYMLSNLNQQSENFSSKKLAFPIGSDHIGNEISEVVQEFNPKNWHIYRTVTD